MISLQANEVEIMCAEMYRYFQEAGQALTARQVATCADASDLAMRLEEIGAFLREVVKQEKEKSGSRKSIQVIELLAGKCSTLEERVKELRRCFTTQGEAWAA